MSPPIQPLSTSNHDRDRAGLRYVYPVVSRRAGGVSIGINLNPNNACNWACIYCQVPNLVRGGPPPLDLALLERELNVMLDDVQTGGFMETQVPPEARHLMDVAFSGNGEPTSAPEFEAAVELVVRVLHQRGQASLALRLITNGSLVRRGYVQAGLRRLAEANGEVWFKVDAIASERVQLINGVSQDADVVLERLRLTAGIVPTWVQTCMMQIDGQGPTDAEAADYLAMLQSVRKEIRGVLLYGLARPSMQPEAGRLGTLPVAWFEEMGRRIESLGLDVKISP